MAQITEIIMTAYERLQKLITDGDIYTKSQLDEKLGEIETKFGIEVAKALQDKIDDGSLGALTIGDGTITTAKMVDGAITSNKIKCGVGVIFETNAITIDFATGFVILDRKINLLIDGEKIALNNNVGDTMPINKTESKTVFIYADLTTKTIKTGIMGADVIPSPSLMLAMIYIGAGGKVTPYLYGNNKSIKVCNKSGFITYDERDMRDKTLIIPQFTKLDNTFNITFDSISKVLNCQFATGRTVLYTYLDGEVLSITKTSSVNTGSVNNWICYLDLVDSTIKFCEYVNFKKNIETSALICAINVSENTVYNYMSCWDTLKWQGEHTQMYKSVILQKTVADIDTKFVKVESEINPDSPAWGLTGGGYDLTKAHVHQELFTSLLLNGMYKVRCGDSNKFNSSSFSNGGHVFEALSKDEKYRLTMVVLQRNDMAIVQYNPNSWVDNMARTCVQTFEPGESRFGWTKIGSDSRYDYMGGWDFTDTMVKAHTPLYLDPIAYPAKMPGKDENGNDIPVKNGTLFRHTDGSLKYRKDGVWYNLVLESEYNNLVGTVNTLTALQAKTHGLSYPHIVLPNGLRNNIELRGDKFYKVTKLSKCVLNGAETWTVKTAGTTANIFACTDLTMENYVGDYSNSANNMLVNDINCRFTSSPTLLNGESVVVMGRATDMKGWMILISTDLATDVASLKTYLASNNITIYYQLANEVTTEIIV